MTAPPPTITLTDIRKTFGTLNVLKGISLTAHEGEVISIIGASGSGKSTLLRCIPLLEVPDSGTIAIGGEVVRMKPAPATRSRPTPPRSTGCAPRLASFSRTSTSGRI